MSSPPVTTPNPMIAPETLSAHLREDDEFPNPLNVELIRRGFNDTYRITTGETVHVLRVYLNGKYYISGPDDFRFELDLLTYLHENGLPVSAPLPLKNGGMLGTIPLPEGSRSYAVFNLAPGEVVEDPSAELASSWGDVVARMHLLTNDFRTSYPRYHLNLKYLADQPFELASRLFANYGRNDLEAYRPLVEALKRPIQALPTDPDAYGIIHGDLHGRNLHFDGNAPTLFDFDHGGFGWRAYDLSVCRGSLQEDTWEAFLESYERVRPLTAAEKAALPAFRALRPLWDMGDILAMKSAWGEDLGTEEDCDRILSLFKRLDDTSRT